MTTPVQRVTIAAIFSVFFRIGLFSFGGGLTGWVYRDVVLMRGWLNEDEFLSGMAVSQILPGANIANLSIYVGQKLRGPLGASVALLGLLTVPFFDLTGPFCARRFERNCLGKEAGHAEEEVWC